MVIESHDDVVYISGSMCVNHWPAILATAYLVYERHPLGVVIDCSGVSFVSQTGAQTFIDALQHIEAEHLCFALVSIPASVQQRLEHNNSHSTHLQALNSHQHETRRIHQAISSSSWWERLWGGADLR